MASVGFPILGFRIALLTVCVGFSLVAPLSAEPTEGTEASIFSYRKSETTGGDAASAAPVLRSGGAVQQATHTAAEAASPRDPRRLAPARSVEAVEIGNPNSRSESKATTSIALPEMESFISAGAGLGIVIGLFLLCMWLIRRSGPRPTSPLPQEAVAVLGRVPLAARHFAHLIQVGRKLVLVSVTPEGVSPITEVSDPMEVDRLLGLCMRNGQHSSTAQFQQVLQQLAQEPARGFLGAEGQRQSSAAGKA